ncbi:Nicotinamide-nucleotide amidohydrolase PncC [Caulifigura coniformis]|uniref:Nicotinamide-nucleotide amidohydrolase PncC n=1 Tax=Caulifigura coniformis TaxID=2527983 RepID=A0A517SGW6_9PLAN|nr:CinA family protein [Caulifigura coniformis]QDT55366.1 Nicotinamide-nucleotide amidohydrolase PncC [Caulifigura coniformis]
MLPSRLIAASLETARLLTTLELKLVIAESCTGGMAAAALSGVPGISNWFCGSMVVYRTETKRSWLGVDPPGFDPAESDSVGPLTSNALARAVARATPEADIAAAISGHLGPNAPADLDGRAFIRISLARPGRDGDEPGGISTSYVSQVRPTAELLKSRSERQEEAATVFLEEIVEFLGKLERSLSWR